MMYNEAETALHKVQSLHRFVDNAVASKPEHNETLAILDQVSTFARNAEAVIQ